MPTFPSTAAFPASVLFPATATFPFGGLTLTNNQKLSLPANTQVGTRVQVTDGFVVAPGFFDQPGLYIASTVYHGKPSYAYVDNPNGSGGFNWSFRYDGSQWNYYQDDDAQDFPDNPGNVEGPWLAEFGQVADLTHPALQQLAAPSTEQGGVFVSDGTQDGIYIIGDNYNGRPRLNLLGSALNGESQSITWNAFGFANKWTIFNADEGDPLYYSASNVATPDLATNWKNTSDDSPASITVTSVSVGDLVAGNKLGSVVRQVNGATNGRNKFTDVLAVAPDLTWDGMKWTDGTTNGSGNTAFPDIGSADPVAAEENWDTIP